MARYLPPIVILGYTGITRAGRSRRSAPHRPSAPDLRLPAAFKLSLFELASRSGFVRMARVVKGDNGALIAWEGQSKDTGAFQSIVQARANCLGTCTRRFAVQSEGGSTVGRSTLCPTTRHPWCNSRAAVSS